MRTTPRKSGYKKPTELGSTELDADMAAPAQSDSFTKKMAQRKAKLSYTQMELANVQLPAELQPSIAEEDDIDHEIAHRTCSTSQPPKCRTSAPRGGRI